MNLKVHLVFAGNCEEALSFYKDVLDGEVGFLFRKQDEAAKNPNISVAEADKTKISHMVVKTKYFDLAGNDTDSNQQVVIGNNNKLILVFHDLKKCRYTFDALAKEGTVTEPFAKNFFCEGFGEVTDKFGIPWIVMMSDEGYEG